MVKTFLLTDILGAVAVQGGVKPISGSRRVKRAQLGNLSREEALIELVEKTIVATLTSLHQQGKIQR